ncbi:VanZ family protein [Gottfriedia sp. NPDC058432]|uniref:VanZ family protein n=1 Tax=Gottfriedia sp. NPDC058432 TaxID=3346497 RepID=UPI00364A7AD6
MKLFMKIVLTLAFCLYLVVLTNQILFKYVSPSEIISHFNFNNNDDRWHGHNFIPLKTIIYYLFLADINLNIRITNIVGNIIGFVPFGFNLPILLKRFKNFKVILITTFSLSLTYELIQLLFDFGSFDIDDLILNTLGGLLGYVPIKLIQLIYNRKNHLKITTDL